MIQCDADGCCEEWYHYKCQNLTDDVVTRIDKYACVGCRTTGLGVTTYKTSNRSGEDASGSSSNKEPEDQIQPVVGAKCKVDPEVSSNASKKNARMASKAASIEIPVHCEDEGPDEHAVARADDKGEDSRVFDDEEADENDH